MKMRAVGAVALGLVLLAGCSTTVTGTGTAPPDAKQLVVDAVDGLRDSDTGYALTVSVDDGSRTVTASARAQGDNGSGTLTVDGDTADLLNVDGDGYAKAPAAFWSDYLLLDDDVAADLDGRWVVIGGTAVNLLTYVSQPALAEQIAKYPTNATFHLVGRGEVDGTPARKIEDADGGTAAVSVDGPLRLLEIGGQQGEFRFSYPTDEVSVTAPDDPVPFPR